MLHINFCLGYFILTEYNIILSLMLTVFAQDTDACYIPQSTNSIIDGRVVIINMSEFCGFTEYDLESTAGVCLI